MLAQVLVVYSATVAHSTRQWAWAGDASLRERFERLPSWQSTWQPDLQEVTPEPLQHLAIPVQGECGKVGRRGGCIYVLPCKGAYQPASGVPASQAMSTQRLHAATSMLPVTAWCRPAAVSPSPRRQHERVHQQQQQLSAAATAPWRACSPSAAHMAAGSAGGFR